MPSPQPPDPTAIWFPPRDTFWGRTFHEARQSGGWMLVPRYYTRSTASQLACDISRAHLRDPERLRMRGPLPGEVWEAQWGPAEDGPDGDHLVSIRLVQSAPDD
jgi:hypothetical protein